MSIIKELFGIGVEPKDLTTIQVTVRAVLMFLYCIFLVRIADKRFLSRKTVLDAVLGFIFASMMARAINGSAPVLPTLVAGLTLVLLHRSLAAAAVRWRGLGLLVKGSEQLVIEDGKPRMDILRQQHFSEADMLEDLRLNGVSSPAEVRVAHIERDGNMSVVKKS